MSQVNFNLEISNERKDERLSRGTSQIRQQTEWRVALGNNRNNGSNLGAFTVNADNGLANANGNNWRARPLLLGKPRRLAFLPSALHLNLEHHSRRLTLRGLCPALAR